MIKIDALSKLGIAVATALLFTGTAALADSWSESFSTVDANGDGTISRLEWDENGSKVKLDAGSEFMPTFAAMDVDGSNSISQDEWDGGLKTAEGYSSWCKESAESWCK
jgi:hypothetical protein